LDYFVLVLFAFVVLGLVSSIIRQEIGWLERLGSELFLCGVRRKTLTQSMSGLRRPRVADNRTVCVCVCVCVCVALA